MHQEKKDRLEVALEGECTPYFVFTIEELNKSRYQQNVFLQSSNSVYEVRLADSIASCEKIGGWQIDSYCSTFIYPSMFYYCS